MEAAPHLMSSLQPTAWITMDGSTAPLNACGLGGCWPGPRMRPRQTGGSQVPQGFKSLVQAVLIVRLSLQDEVAMWVLF